MFHIRPRSSWISLFRPNHVHRRRLATASPHTSDQPRIVEVGPRDGLQNEKLAIPLATKIELINRLSQTGLQTIEAGSFVSSKWVPQMTNSAEILQTLLEHPPAVSRNIIYQFLVPNEKGLEAFLGVYSKHLSKSPSQKQAGYAGFDIDNSGVEPLLEEKLQRRDMSPPIELSIFTAATETFTRKNTNCSIEESLTRFKPIFNRAKGLNIKVRAYISVALGCPFEGPNVNPHQVAELAIELLEMGADEISVADTTGMGTAPKTKELLRTLASAGVENGDIAMHFHDTYGQALVNAVVALEHGIRTFDASVGGLGGCPFSPGATGNLSTEDLIHCFHSLGANTGVDIEKLAQVGDWISGELKRVNESRAGKATLAKLRNKT